MAEVIAANKSKIDASDVLLKLNVETNKYIVLSAHREENIDNPVTFESLMSAVNMLAKTYGFPVIYSVHPRSAKFIKERNFKFHSLVRELPPFRFTDYSKLIENAYCVVSDSGTLPEEASISRFPSVSIRTSTERPEALEKGVLILGGFGEGGIIKSVEIAVKMFEKKEQIESVLDYQTLNVSSKIIKLIQSYTDIVRLNIWREQV